MKKLIFVFTAALLVGCEGYDSAPKKPQAPSNWRMIYNGLGLGETGFCVVEVTHEGKSYIVNSKVGIVPKSE